MRLGRMATKDAKGHKDGGRRGGGFEPKDIEQGTSNVEGVLRSEVVEC